ncbi:Nucleotide-sugar transporter [Artemisia annua]|uniref:Nucleotide-sugar transporter n=1 Tax=Artemisia annua TaxID=35608 RepID=A0A2U1N2J8_ARTAN|nr:Nucleotide-sugar transporter [Artemisia annua]
MGNKGMHNQVAENTNKRKKKAKVTNDKDVEYNPEECSDNEENYQEVATHVTAPKKAMLIWWQKAKVVGRAHLNICHVCRFSLQMHTGIMASSSYFLLSCIFGKSPRSLKSSLNLLVLLFGVRLSTTVDEVSVYPIPASLYLVKNLLQYYIFAYVDAPVYQILKNRNIISTGVLYRIILKRKLSTTVDEVSVYPIPASLYLVKNLLQYYIFAYVDAPVYQILKNRNIISTGVLYRIILKRNSDHVLQTPFLGWMIAIVNRLFSLFLYITEQSVHSTKERSNVMALLSCFAGVYTKVKGVY